MPESWARQRLGFDRAWPLTKGRNVKVAVIDSGAEPSHPMLSGRISKFDDLTRTGANDCLGHGTGVAALIGGRDLRVRGAGVALSGVAPECELLVIKHQNVGSDEDGGARLPDAIRAAVRAGAEVVNVSIRARYSPELDAAVREALRKDVVIVAAAGNTRENSADEGPAYPASYAGVISVASLGPDGSRVETSGLRSRVDLGAPGKDVPTAWTGGGYNPQAEGTSFAAAFVSGVAALVRSRHPGLRGDQVVHRILATADGNAGDGTGRGMVNPVQAVTAVLPEEGASAGTERPAAPLRFAAPVPRDERTYDMATWLAAIALGCAVLAAVAGVVVPMGRRRGWRPGVAVIPHRFDDEQPDVVSPSGGTIGAEGVRSMAP